VIYMETPIKDYITTDNILLWLVIIMWAMANAMNEWKLARDGKGEEKFDFIDFLLILFMSIFAGAIFLLFAMMLNFGILQVMLSSWVGAFLGIDWLKQIAKKVLDIYLALKIPGQW